VPPIPDKPTFNEVRSAIALILEPFSDFPFTSDASRAHATAAILTPFLRPIIVGPVPLNLVDKPIMGTGAGLLVEIINIVATGYPAAMLTAPKSDEEWSKIITSKLSEGALIFNIDNIEGKLTSPSLAAAITANCWEGRILGQSKMGRFPCRVTWIGNGNNIKLGGDLPRRCIWIRMDAKMSQPWRRPPECFKHPQLEKWVYENRGAYIAAILTVIRAWFVAGKPEASGSQILGKFEDYCCILGGVLNFMGIKGFLGNLDAMYGELDTETPQWDSFLSVWHKKIGNKPVTVSELLSHIKSDTELRGALPDYLADINAENYTLKLGNALAKHKDNRYANGLMLTNGPKVKHKSLTWVVIIAGSITNS